MDPFLYSPPKPIRATPGQKIFEAVPSVFISTDASFHLDRVAPGQAFSLVVTLDRAAQSNHNVTASRRRARRLILNRQRGQGGGRGKLIQPKPVDTTDYALQVTAPAGFNYRSIATDPRLDLQNPQPVSTPPNSLMWARVPLPQYADVRAVQAFRLTFNVTSAAALGRQFFTASVWLGGDKIHESKQDVRGLVFGKEQGR